MKLINHMIFVDVNDSSKLVVNALDGTMDAIDMPTYAILTQWQPQAHIVPSTPQEIALYDTLQARGYLVENDAEEGERKNTILTLLREHHTKERDSAKHLTFIMTYDCNFRCPYCFEGESNVKKDVITPAMIDAAFELTQNNVASILLFGGEPLLPKTKQAVAYILSKAPNKTYEIITNGYYLDAFIDMLSKVQVTRITVTLDGEEKEHDSKRYLANKKPTFQKIIQNIGLALDVGIPICVRVNVDSTHADAGANVQQYLAEKFPTHKDLLQFQIVTMLDKSDADKSDFIAASFHNLVSCEYDERLRRDRGLLTYTPLINAVTYGMPMNPLYSHCYAHESKWAVDPYGKFYTCLVTVGKEGMAAGTYYPTVTFKEQSIYNRNIDKIPECRECKYSLLCGGGCPLRLQDYSNLFKPVCSSVKTLIHNLLPRLYLAEQANKQKQA